MHEIVGPVLYILERELESFQAERAKLSVCTNEMDKEKYSFLKFLESVSEQTLEAHTYWIFEKIMNQLEPLYDPVVRPDGQPQVVHFCTNLQGFDPIR
jgi:hypothetical protein